MIFPLSQCQRTAPIYLFGRNRPLQRLPLCKRPFHSGRKVRHDRPETIMRTSFSRKSYGRECHRNVRFVSNAWKSRLVKQIEGSHFMVR